MKAKQTDNSALHQADAATTDRAFTLKSLVFGVLGIFLVAGLADFGDSRVQAGALWVGSHMPVAVFAYVVFVALVWNGLLAKRLPALALSSRELTVVMIMALVAGFPPTSSLFRYFHRQLMLPWYYLSTGGKGDWEAYQLFGYLPSKLFPSPAPQLDAAGKLVPESISGAVYQGFFTGGSESGGLMPFKAVPWGAWMVPLLYWGPLVVAMSVCSTALALLVHRQWAHHEQLSYPLAQVATSIIKRKHGKGVPDLFRNRLFWWGMFPILLIYILEYLHAWFPEQVPGLDAVLPNVKTWELAIHTKLPILKKAAASGALRHGTIYFSVIGLAYFVASEVSLTMGLTVPLLTLFGVVFFTVTGAPLTRGDMDIAHGGAYLGYALIMLYTGRTYYWSVVRAAFWMPGRDVDSASVMAARITVLSFVAFVAILTMMGLDWVVALLFGLCVMLLFLVFTRIICETGIPFLQVRWRPAGMLTSLFGPAALGPGPLVFVLYLGTILCWDPRECLMPYVSTGLKMADDQHTSLKRVFRWMIAAVLIALVIGFVAKTWQEYSFGGMMGDKYSAQSPPQVAFDTAARSVAEMDDMGILDRSAAATGIRKFGLFSPDPTALGYFGFGVLAVAALSLVRFRVAKFPIHPVLFLAWGTYPANLMWSSFMIGWAIKSLVVRFGGGRVYQDVKPLFIGIIVAEILICAMAILIGMLLYALTGSPPDIRFGVLPL